jgi:mono/diheme cytochrome c family protein
MPSPRMLVAAMVVAVVSLTTAACGAGDDVPVPSDPVLAQGQKVYNANCASCHGAKGGGGLGMKLADVVEGRYPNIDDQIAVIAEGRAGMPGFAGKLSAEELEAVARYEREGF